ncbi:MAG TPA: hypothetical protein VGE66_12455 [Chitinophagaceae bacterium]
MLRRLTILVLLVAFAAQTFQQAAIVLDYYVRTAAYEKACVNKARPQLRCKGKCQMAKKMAEEEQKSQQAPQMKLEKPGETLSSESFFTLAPLPVPASLPLHYPVLNAGAPVAQTHAIFHPPALV